MPKGEETWELVHGHSTRGIRRTTQHLSRKRDKSTAREPHTFVPLESIRGEAAATRFSGNERHPVCLVAHHPAKLVVHPFLRTASPTSLRCIRQQVRYVPRPRPPSLSPRKSHTPCGGGTAGVLTRWRRVAPRACVLPTPCCRSNKRQQQRTGWGTTTR